MRRILPLFLAVLGIGVGAGAGYLMRPAADHGFDQLAEPGEPACPTPSHAEAELGGHTPAHAPNEVEYVKLNNQFVVPVIDSGDIRSLVILSLSVETEAGGASQVYAREPRLRDALLRVLFDHANSGGFDGPFTESGTLETLRREMRDAAQDIIGPSAHDVLILDIIRQKA
ncbi:flagellar basal body-associated FliL family protein [Defluviimonas sp. WL0002]|uniref:Flagellar protein FliL n=1 Tax=Albidovulum marisflavi TaxID=2984159 RepID=A0ABT2Z7E8_9RHOB|nr:flagellar basal body-associated FliL family protein [Defluviimonas sp. WL0002]MCV2867060.1 flagellar basal body-associated FliL family protein [Defluviimonas sp. WL0002]